MRTTDLVILGAGGAGISASIYALRYRLDHVVIGQLAGGTLQVAHLVENYPGYSSILGSDLSQKFEDHLHYLGGKITNEFVISIKKEGEWFLTETDKELYKSRAIIYGFGSNHRHLGVPGEHEFAGRGVSYCSTCDGAFFREKTVAVIGGGDSAATGALVLGNLAAKTYLIHRGEKLKAEPIWVEQILQNPKIEILYNTNVVEIIGDTKVRGIKLDHPYHENEILDLDGVFIEIGLDPASKLAQEAGVIVDSSGYIKVGEDMSTNVPGFFAAGDVTTGSAYFRQLVTAASEGVIATYGVYKYLQAHQ